ncbi:MAG: hypothetical protein ACKOEZ_04410 [Spartobacteria bacterium]
MIRFFLRLDFFTCYPLRPTPLPAHAGDEVGHGEAEEDEDEDEEGGDGGANGDDPEGGQEREGLGGEAFTGMVMRGEMGFHVASQPASPSVRTGKS